MFPFPVPWSNQVQLVPVQTVPAQTRSNVFDGAFGAQGIALLTLGYLVGRYSGPRPMMAPQVLVIDGTVRR